MADAMGVSRPLVSKWERGESVPNVDQYTLWAELTKARWLIDILNEGVEVEIVRR